VKGVLMGAERIVVDEKSKGILDSYLDGIKRVGKREGTVCRLPEFVRVTEHVGLATDILSLVDVPEDEVARIIDEIPYSQKLTHWMMTAVNRIEETGHLPNLLRLGVTNPNKVAELMEEWSFTLDKGIDHLDDLARMDRSLPRDLSTLVRETMISTKRTGLGLFTADRVYGAFIAWVKKEYREPSQIAQWYREVNYKHLMDKFLEGYTEQELTQMMNNDSRPKIVTVRILSEKVNGVQIARGVELAMDKVPLPYAHEALYALTPDIYKNTNARGEIVDHRQHKYPDGILHYGNKEFGNPAYRALVRNYPEWVRRYPRRGIEIVAGNPEQMELIGRYFENGDI